MSNIFVGIGIGVGISEDAQSSEPVEDEFFTAQDSEPFFFQDGQEIEPNS